MANVLAAIAPIICATASCLPTGAPHCTRSAAHVRAICRHRLPAATEGEGRNGALGEAREVALLLLFGPEQLERLGHADRLVGGEQRGDRAVDAGHETDGARVAVLREAESPVFPRDFDAEGAQLPEAVD